MIIAVVVLVSLLFAWGAYKLTVGSIERLGTQIGSFYPFDVRVRKTNAWSALFYIFVIVALFSIIFIFSKDGLTRLPGLPA